MQGYRPVPPPTGVGAGQVRHEEVAQHLAATIPGFGNPAGLRFRGAVHATTAFVQPRAGPPGDGGSAPHIGTSVVDTVSPAYAAPSGAHVEPTYGAPVRPVSYGAPTGPSHGTPAATVATAPTVALPPASAPPTSYARVDAEPYGYPAHSTSTGAAVESNVVPASIEAPQDFTCPITQEIMTDPVICADGHSYERDAITRWLASHNTSPKTNAQLEHNTLIPNHTLRGSIEQFVEEKRRRGC